MLIPVTDEQAKAVQEVAKVAGKAMDLLGGVGAYLRGVIGTIPEDVIGRFAGDVIAEDRKQNKERLARRAGDNLRDIPVERIVAPSPSMLLPLLSAAQDENRETLQDLWAALLANTLLDTGRVRRDYFDAVRQMEPEDAAVLHLVASRLNAHTTEKGAMDADVSFLERERATLGISPDDFSISLAKLIKLDCVSVQATRSSMGAVAPYPEPREYPPSLTPFGRGLLAACRKP